MIKETKQPAQYGRAAQDGSTFPLWDSSAGMGHTLQPGSKEPGWDI